MKLILVFFIIGCANAFNSINNIKERVKIENKIVLLLNKYIKTAESDISQLKRLVKDFTNEHNKIGKTVDTYIENPVNGYLLTKRLTKQLQQIEQLMYNAPKEYEDEIKMVKYNQAFPGEREFRSAINAVAAIRSVYNLPSSEISSGSFTGLKQPVKYQLNAELCMELARFYYEENPLEAEYWVKEAATKCLNKNNCSQELKEIMLEYTAFIQYYLGRPDFAYTVMESLLDLNPRHPRASGNMHFFKYEMNHTPPEQRKNQVVREPDGKITDKLSYSLTCRGLVKPVPMDLPYGYLPSCRYRFSEEGYFRLAPFKMEHVYSNPLIIIYRDFITDNEINTIKKLFKNNEDKLFQEKEGKDPRHKNEISFEDDRNPTFDLLSMKLEEATYMDRKESTPLNVVNFEMGGETRPHYDYMKDTPEHDKMILEGKGDVFLTAMLHLSNVKKGGATVFPRLQLSIPQEKGSVVIWYNYDGENPDPKTLHGECPLIVGDKWVANKRFYRSDY